MKGHGQMCVLHIYISYLAGNYNQQKAHCLIEVIVQGQMCMLHIYISYLACNNNQQKAHCLIEVIVNVKTNVCCTSALPPWLIFSSKKTLAGPFLEVKRPHSGKH